MARLGIDFGTSNTGAGILRDGRPAALPLEAGAQTLPTAVFVDFTDKRFVYGEAAARAMMEGQDGRFMRGLKSILGTPLAREKRRFLNERMTLIEVIGRFLAEIRCRSERITGQSFEAAISGRPVRFHSESEDKDAQAEIDLREANPFGALRMVFGGGRLLRGVATCYFLVSLARVVLDAQLVNYVSYRCACTFLTWQPSLLRDSQLVNYVSYRCACMHAPKHAPS